VEVYSEGKEIEGVHVPKFVSLVVEELICGNNKVHPCKIHCCNKSGLKDGRICCRRESLKSVKVENLRRG